VTPMFGRLPAPDPVAHSEGVDLNAAALGVTHADPDDTLFIQTIPLLTVCPQDHVLLTEPVVLGRIALRGVPRKLGEPAHAVQTEVLEIELRVHAPNRPRFPSVVVHHVRQIVCRNVGQRFTVEIVVLRAETKLVQELHCSSDFLREVDPLLRHVEGVLQLGHKCVPLLCFHLSPRVESGCAWRASLTSGIPKWVAFLLYASKNK
jgi:hypothetical protein